MKRRLRDPGRTRQRLLQAAFREVRRSGFQSAGIDTILAATNVTKGALYHHFESKEALGYAIVGMKIVAKLVRDRWLHLLLSDGQSILILIGIVRALTANSARRRSRKLPAAQFGAGDVSAGRTVPQATGEDFSRLAGRNCHALAERAVPGNSSPRPNPATRLRFLVAMWFRATRR